VLLDYSCRRSNPLGQPVSFQLCVAERDGQGGWAETLLTNDGKQHLTPQWSTDGHFIVFHQMVAGPDCFSFSD
jgi:Tol biopolymer transport system component